MDSRWMSTVAVSAVLACTISVATATASAAWIATTQPQTAPSPSARAAVALEPGPTGATTVTQVVSSSRDAGPGSLRRALRAAAKRPASTTTHITFSSPGTLTLRSDLPAIRGRVVIDGTATTGYVAGGAPVVGVDANGWEAFRFARGSSRSQLLGIAVTRAGGNGVTVAAPGIALDGNHIGLPASGHLRGDMHASGPGNRGHGISLERGASGTRIGANASLTVGAVGNVISNNSGAGIHVDRASSTVIESNRIGTNRAGTRAMGNRRSGIELVGARRTTIGGNAIGSNSSGPNNPTGSKGTVTPNYVAPPLGNLISGNRQEGVLISSRSRKTQLEGNFIGTDAAGTAAVPNGRNGVRVIDSEETIFRGCTLTDEPFVYYNVISGNNHNGIHITDSHRTVVQANFFGVGMDNTTIVPNRRNGMLFDGDSTKPHVGGVIPLGNVAAGNRHNGIAVRDKVRGFISFNTFGGLLAFKGAAPNGRNGLMISSRGGNNHARTNVFSGNRRNGILLTGSAQGVTVDPNLVGLTTSGSTALPNGRHGVLINGDARRNTIGGNRTSVIPQNTLSGNRRYGLVLAGNARDNRVFNTYAGVATGITVPVPNLKGGVLVTGRARGNILRATGSEKINVFSGNRGYGVVLTRHTRRNVIARNNIGTGREGLPVPNSRGTVVDRGDNIVRNNRTN